jgi:hypothetical protein
MSDRVSFATTEDTITPANSSGFNGFPIPYITGSQGAFNPYNFSFDNCIKMWWRIKNWTLTTDASVTKDGVTGSVVNGDLVPFGQPASEMGLIYAANNPFLNSSDGVWALALIGNIHYDTGTLYPSMSTDMHCDASGTGARLAVRFFSPDPTLGAATGSITGTILGQTKTIYYWTSGAPDSFTFSTFVLEPVDWWPYKNTLGNPVWNTSTGAQINDPLS